MAKPVLLSIGATDSQEEAHAAAPAQAEAARAGGLEGSSQEVYELLRRHEETLRDLIVEIRLLYHSLSEKEQRLLEGRRDATTRGVREEFAPRIQALESAVSRLRGGR